MKRIFIIGVNGYIGIRLKQNLSNSYDVKSVSSDNKDGDLYLNLENPEKFDYEQIKEGDTVIHLAAISSPDECTKEYDHSYQINVRGAIYFIDKCLGRGARILFFSSDVVYGASDIKRDDDYFNERSECNPLGKYGEMKREVEKKFLGKDNFKVFRLSYVFSKNDKFSLYLKDCCKRNEIANIFPFCRNVIYIDDVVLAVDKLIDKWQDNKEAIFNLAGPETICRQKMAELYKKEIDTNLQIKITNPGEEFFQNRPKIIRTESLYLERLLGKLPVKIDQAYKIEKKMT